MTERVTDARLRELAEAATPGEWYVSLGLQLRATGVPSRGIVACWDCCRGTNPRDHEADMEFMAAANPATVLDLLGRLERVEALIEDWLSEVDWSNGRSNYGDNEAYEKCARDLRDALDGGGE